MSRRTGTTTRFIAEALGLCWGSENQRSIFVVSYMHYRLAWDRNWEAGVLRPHTVSLPTNFYSKHWSVLYSLWLCRCWSVRACVCEGYTDRESSTQTDLRAVNGPSLGSQSSSSSSSSSSAAAAAAGWWWWWWWWCGWSGSDTSGEWASSSSRCTHRSTAASWQRQTSHRCTSSFVLLLASDL